MTIKLVAVVCVFQIHEFHIIWACQSRNSGHLLLRHPLQHSPVLRDHVVRRHAAHHRDHAHAGKPHLHLRLHHLDVPSLYVHTSFLG